MASTFDQRKPNDVPSIQTGSTEPTSRWRRARPTTSMTSSSIHPTTQEAKPAHTLKSKMSIFSLFSRPKVEKLRGYNEAGLAPVEAPPPRSPTKPPGRRLSKSSTSGRSAKTHTKEEADWIPSPVKAKEPVPAPASKPKLKPTKQPSLKLPHSASWDPPPLFQAYPQSIRHASLQSTSASADSILRAYNHKRQASLMQDMMESKIDLGEEGDGKNTDSGHKRNSSGSTPNVELVEKIFVLVTSGYMLQYSADGTFDRLPEKVLQLGKDSVAFASDIVPGKHWVLQISQAANAEGAVTALSARSLLSRLWVQNAAARRTTASFLLIFGSAKEMESWMTLIRKEVEALGGKKYRPELGERKRTDESVERKLRQKPSHRFQIQRDPDRVSVIQSPVKHSLDSPAIVTSDWETRSHRFRTDASDAGSVHSSKYQPSLRPSIEAPSLATNFSADHFNLQQLKEGSRLSYMSSRTGTLTNSRTSSPAASPRSEVFPKQDTEPVRNPSALRSSFMAPTTATSVRRRSMQTLPTTQEDQPQSSYSSKPQRHSTYAGYEQRHATAGQRVVAAPPPLRLSTWPLQAPPAPAPVTRSRSSPSPRPSIPPTIPDDAPLGQPLPASPTLPQLNTQVRSAASRQSPAASNPNFRPFPVRPYVQTQPVPRRYSSMPLGPALPVNPTPPLSKRVSSLPSANPHNQHPQAVTPSQTSSTSSSAFSCQAASTYRSYPSSNSSYNTPQPPQNQPPALRRPASMQIRSSPAPFLSSTRPAVNPRSSSMFGNRASSQLNLGGVGNQPASATGTRPRMTVRKSMPVLGYGPPAPPPNLPLPPPPPNMAVAGARAAVGVSP